METEQSISDLTDAVGGQPGAFAMIAKPTVMQRIWRIFGFRYHLGIDPEGTDNWPGWTRTEIKMRFGVSDRILLLFTGKLNLVSISSYDAPAPSEIKNRLDWHILPPFYKE